MADAPPASPASPLTDPILAQLYAYWLSKRRSAGRVPVRSDVSPTELPPSVLPHIMLLDLDRQGDTVRIRIRLTGTHIDEAFGQNPTGRAVTPDLYNNASYVDYLQTLYAQMVEGAAPIYSENVFQLGGQMTRMLTKRLSLPLSTDGSTIDMALVGVVFEHPRNVAAHYGQNLDRFSETVRQVLTT